MCCFVTGIDQKAGAGKLYLVLKIILLIIIQEDADVSGRAVKGGGLRAARLMGLRVRIPRETWMCVSCECFVLSSKGLCVGLITRQEESHRVWCV